MKTNFKLNTGAFVFNKEVRTVVIEDGIQTGSHIENIPVEIPSISIDVATEYTISEMFSMWELIKKVSDESPEVLEAFVKKAVNLSKTVKRADKEIKRENC